MGRLYTIMIHWREGLFRESKRWQVNEYTARALDHCYHGLLWLPEIYCLEDFFQNPPEPSFAPSHLHRPYPNGVEKGLGREGCRNCLEDGIEVYVMR